MKTLLPERRSTERDTGDGRCQGHGGPLFLRLPAGFVAREASLRRRPGARPAHMYKGKAGWPIFAHWALLPLILVMYQWYISIVTGGELRDRRVKARLTQAQLAERLGTTVTTVARWERGERAIAEPIARFIELLHKTEWKRRRRGKKAT